VLIFFPLQIHFDTSSRYEIPRKNSEAVQNMATASTNAESTYESVGPSEIVYERKPNPMEEIQKNFGDAPPLPPPLPPPIKGNNHNFIRNSIDSLADSIDDTSLECSDSGLEVVEEPTLRPSELVRGNNNRSMSIISGEFAK
jgi:hypothetical protein